MNTLLTLTKDAIDFIDETLSRQIREILLHNKFQQLESSWRGLQLLTNKIPSADNIKIKLLSINKVELGNDLLKAETFEQSHTCHRIHDSEDMFRLHDPFSLMIGDYAFDHSSQDILMLKVLSQIAEYSFCPFITSPSPVFFGLEKWSENSQLTNYRLSTQLSSSPYSDWNNLRSQYESRFLVMVLPKYLSRLGYSHTSTEQSLLFSHINDLHCWSNTAYLLAICIMNAFQQEGISRAIHGAESGGKIEITPIDISLHNGSEEHPAHPLIDIMIDEKIEHELCRNGFMPLIGLRHSNSAIFFSRQTVYRPQEHSDIEVDTNNHIAASLPFIMCCSRFMLYLTAIPREYPIHWYWDEAFDMNQYLNNWIKEYTNENHEYTAEKFFPLKKARIDISPAKGMPGCFLIIADLLPRLLLAEASQPVTFTAIRQFDY